MGFEILQNAVFISDAHANTNKQNFTKWLVLVSQTQPKFSQIFLMGDMFDFLSDMTYVKDFYAKEIELINKLSQIYEIFYFEGNHDFNLSKIFPKVRVFSIVEQPVKFSSKAGDIFLAHGDKHVPLISKIFMLSLRNKTFLKFMDRVDRCLNFRILKAILNSQKSKILYKKHLNFRLLIEKKLKFYNSKYIIEGHYHQDEILKFNETEYINLNSFEVIPKIYIAEFNSFGLNLAPFEYNELKKD
ncbi:MAG: UDP-2,3-diacylglucosamine diphosphatase [Campylobacter sp.]|nr:UDP-2,3-diacylglucosamine diphosphatase [Campylobacter sp.]